MNWIKFVAGVGALVVLMGLWIYLIIHTIYLTGGGGT